MNKVIRHVLILSSLALLPFGVSACANRNEAIKNEHVSETEHMGYNRNIHQGHKTFTKAQNQKLINLIKKDNHYYKNINQTYVNYYKKFKKHPRRYAKQIKKNFRISKATNRKVASGSQSNDYFTNDSHMGVMFQKAHMTDVALSYEMKQGRPKASNKNVGYINRLINENDQYSISEKQNSKKFTKLCNKINRTYNK